MSKRPAARTIYVEGATEWLVDLNEMCNCFTDNEREAAVRISEGKVSSLVDAKALVFQTPKALDVLKENDAVFDHTRDIEDYIKLYPNFEDTKVSAAIYIRSGDLDVRTLIDYIKALTRLSDYEAESAKAIQEYCWDKTDDWTMLRRVAAMAGKEGAELVRDTVHSWDSSSE